MKWTSRPPRLGRAASRRACSITSAAESRLGGTIRKRPPAVLFNPDRDRFVAAAIEICEHRRR
jgi:hypothetical protein